MNNLFSKEAAVNKIIFELIRLNKAYDDLYRKAKTVEVLLDDKITPSDKGITYDEVVNNLTHKILALEVSETNLLNEITRINGVNKDYEHRLTLSKEQIDNIRNAKMQQQKKYKRNISIAGVIIIALVLIISYFMFDILRIRNWYE